MFDTAVVNDDGTSSVDGGSSSWILFSTKGLKQRLRQQLGTSTLNCCSMCGEMWGVIEKKK